MTPSAARTLVRTNTTVIGALAVRRGEADALICGLDGRFQTRLRADQGHHRPCARARGLRGAVVGDRATGAFFLADTHVRYDPNAEEIADVAIACAGHVRRFGITPKIALISHSDFGSADTPSALKMRAALEILRQRAPDLEVDGEMQADTALSRRRARARDCRIRASTAKPMC